MLRKRLLALSLAGLVGLAGRPLPSAALTRGDQEAGPTPPRLSFIDGEVSFWRPGAEDWAPAQVNTPLAAGDSLYTADGANLELQIGAGAFVRAGAGTELGLESLESGVEQFKLTAGHAAVDARRLPSGQAIEVDTPNGAFTIDHPGYYRIDVDQDRTMFSTRRGGEATLVPANGQATDIGPDQQVVLEGSDTPQLTTNAAPDPDEWDRWNLERTGRESQPSRSAQYVPPEVAGAEDLDQYGDWRETPRYGHVWVPHDVPPDWAPYSTGRWMWDPYYDWTWVDDAPWGWAPYHYGRWVNEDGFWGWAPGPIVAAPVFAPALVAFFGPSLTVSVGLPFPFVGWVALGFGEPLIPWWGPVGFIGTCWWGGWGGPRIVNNIVIQNNTFVNVRNVTVFQNTQVHNAVIAVNRDHFGRGRVDPVRVAAADAKHLRPMRGGLPIKPARESLVAREGHGVRPPGQVHARPVVATRTPQDPARRLQAAGLDPGRVAKVPPPRLVQAPSRPHRGGPGGGLSGQAAAARRAGPPPPPRMARHGGGQERATLSGGGRQTPLEPARREHPGGAAPRERTAPPPPPSATHQLSRGGGGVRQTPLPPPGYARRGHPGGAAPRERTAPPPPPSATHKLSQGGGRALQAPPPPPGYARREHPGGAAPREHTAPPPPRLGRRTPETDRSALRATLPPPPRTEGRSYAHPTPPARNRGSEQRVSPAPRSAQLPPEARRAPRPSGGPERPAYAERSRPLGAPHRPPAVTFFIYRAPPRAQSFRPAPFAHSAPAFHARSGQPGGTPSQRFSAAHQHAPARN